jgi:hypothetical protein
MKPNLYILSFALLFTSIFAQKTLTPLETSGYKELTNYNGIIDFITNLPKDKAPFQIEYFAKSASGRDIPAIKFSQGDFGKDSGKLKVILFAQQHGNEPSGKEALLIAVAKFTSGELEYLLDKLDIVIIPEMNPDGNEANKRRNGNRADLNRDHLLLLQPEIEGLHKFFNKYSFEVSLDIHEYSPYSEDWINFGYIKNSAVQVGRLTNINTPEEIRKFEASVYMPYIAKSFFEAGVSYSEYNPGGPPEKEYIRLSTFDINDGRQSFGSLGTISFIQEGKNGRDSIDNIEMRAKSQLVGILGYLEFAYKNADQMKKMVNSEREKIIDGSPEKVAVQMIHVNDGSKLTTKLLSLATNNDTTITINNYRPVVKSIFNVNKPIGYLIPTNDTLLVQWAKRHDLKIGKYTKKSNAVIEEYTVTTNDSIDFEGDIVINPSLETKIISPDQLTGEYYLISTKQLAGNVIVQALEPKSIIGLVTYKPFEYLIKNNMAYPILRLMK